MPHELALPKKLKNEGWKVKIREKERVEPPHVTVMCRTKEWRVCLRTKGFLVPPGGAWKDIDPGVKAAIDAAWDTLKTVWDGKYPENPISSKGKEGGDE